MTILPYGHGEFEPFGGEEIRTMAEHGIGGHDVVQGREAVAAATFQKEAEILRMSVRRGEEMEKDLGFQKGFPVGKRFARSQEEPQDADDSGPSVGFVLESRGRAGRLTQILLREPDDPGPVAGKTPVETFHGQGLRSSRNGRLHTEPS